MSYDDFDIDRARELREKAKDGVVKEVRKSLIRTVLASLPVMMLVFFAAIKWASVTGPESRMFYLLLGLLGLLTHTGMWAVYGMDARLLFLLKEIKQLRLDFLISREEPLERATGGAESLSRWASGALKPKALFVVVLTVSVLAAGVVLITHELSHKHLKTFGGQEVVEVHVTSKGMFRVVSRISITKCADNVASIPLRLPQPGATLESVTVDGRQIPFASALDKKDTYIIMPGMPEEALKNAMLEVVWSPQAADIKIQGDRRHFPLQLQGIIPFTAYTANVTIDDGAPYQFAYPGKSSVKGLNLFWSSRPNKDYCQDSLGFCTVAIEQSPNAP